MQPGTLTEELVAWLADLEDYHDRRADPDGWTDPGEHDALMARKADLLGRMRAAEAT